MWRCPKMWQSINRAVAFNGREAVIKPLLLALWFCLVSFGDDKLNIFFGLNRVSNFYVQDSCSRLQLQQRSKETEDELLLGKRRRPITPKEAWPTKHCAVAGSLSFVGRIMATFRVFRCLRAEPPAKAELFWLLKLFEGSSEGIVWGNCTVCYGADADVSSSEVDRLHLGGATIVSLIERSSKLL